MASISGLVGIAQQGAYCVTKGAVVQLTRQMAVEYASRGVRVNAVAPGAIETTFFLGALPPDPTEALAEIGARIRSAATASPARSPRWSRSSPAIARST